jgi:hypothetical protein
MTPHQQQDHARAQMHLRNLRLQVRQSHSLLAWGVLVSRVVVNVQQQQQQQQRE